MPRLPSGHTFFFIDLLIYHVPLSSSFLPSDNDFDHVLDPGEVCMMLRFFLRGLQLLTAGDAMAPEDLSKHVDGLLQSVPKLNDSEEVSFTLICLPFW